MQIETLKIFCDLVETQSFSQAAERNFVTQSAVSQQVRGLEEKFRRKLLERARGRREITVTEAGAVFHQQSRQVLAAYGELLDAMAAEGGTVRGAARVATVYSLGLHELPSALRRFMSLYPEAKIDLEYCRSPRVVDEVMRGAVDLGVLAYPVKQDGLKIVPLSGDRLVLITAPEHPLARRKKVSAKDLEGLDFVLFERNVPTRLAFDRLARNFGLTVRRVGEFDNIETIKRAVEVGLGVAIVPQPSVRREQKQGSLAVVALREPEWTREVGVIYRQDRTLSAAARKFIELLQERRVSNS
jgi:DNA-binding transcriptional LysR family regulator